MTTVRLSRPLIGVVPLWDDKLNSLWMLPGYFDGIIEAGGIPVMLPLTDDETTIEQLVGQCDGFLVTGGHDVDPERSNGILSSPTEPIATNVASSAPSSTPADASSRQSRRNAFQEMACPHP